MPWLVPNIVNSSVSRTLLPSCKNNPCPLENTHYNRKKEAFLPIPVPQGENHNLHNTIRFFSCFLKTILIQFCNLFSPLKSIEYKVHFLKKLLFLVF